MSLQNLGLDGSKSELNNLQVLVKCKPRGRAGAQIWPQILKKHRIKSPETTYGVPACVARPVGKKEIASQPKAREAAVKEWKRLWEKDDWDANVVREWHDVAAEARKDHVDVHMGRLFGIMVEKAAELPEGDPRTKYPRETKW